MHIWFLKQSSSDSSNLGGIHMIAIVRSYSAGQKKRYEYYLMKQKCQLQMGIAQCKNADTPLKPKRINNKYQHFQIRYIFFLAEGAQKLSA